MRQPARIVSAGLASVMIAAALIAAPIPVAARGPVSTAPEPAPVAATADLAPALAADGTFRGAPGLDGTVDAGAWTLVSNLAAGEPPRFTPATGTVSPAAATPAGTWAALGSNGSGGPALNNLVYALAVSGTNLYVGGGFTHIDGIAEATYVAKWDGSAWSALGDSGAGVGPLNYVVYALAVSGSDLYVGGGFTDVAGIPEADYVAKWNGVAWSALGSNGSGDGALNNAVIALAVSGSDVYVGGGFLDAAGIGTADNIAKWDGSHWSALGDNGAGDGALNRTVNALAVSGSDLYAGGWFLNAGGIAAADWVAKWNGSAWSALGSNGAGDGALNDVVEALVVSGSDLYVGGRFKDAAGIATADRIAKWNGSAWFALGSNGSGDGVLDFPVDALAVSGSDLYVGGEFSNAAGIPEADGIAKWNGSAWSALGSNGAGNGLINNPGGVYDLAVSGSNLYVGGAFYVAGMKTANVAAWGMVPSAPPATIRKPDGRIRLGTGAYVGNNVYNTTGASQNRTGSALRGHSVSFGISIQNDGSAADRFKVKATGAATSKYTVKYYRGTTDITAKVVAGTFLTSPLAPGATYVITAKVTVKSSATKGSSVARLVTLTSAASAAAKDAVKLIGKRR